MLYNIDCIEGAQVYLKDESTDLIIADPPFNLKFGGTTQTKTKKPRFNIIQNDNLSHREYQRFTLSWLKEAYRVLKQKRHIYVFIDWRMYPFMSLWMQKVGFHIKNMIVWDKVNMGLGYQYRFQHELIIFAVKGRNKVRRISTRAATDIWRIPKISGNKTIHPTEKPVELMRRIIQNSSEKGENIVDFFSGSGPVSEAAIREERSFTAFEVDADWYDVSKKRIETIIG